MWTKDRSVTNDTHAHRNRERMIAKVKRFWVKGVLENSLYGAARLQLGMTYDPDAIAQSWTAAVQTPFGTDWGLPSGTAIVDVFDEAGGELLILGTPGSGKTTLLLDLARDLIARAENDPDAPIPVVCNLSSWAEKRRPLDDWLIEELNVRYQVPRQIGARWLKTDALLLLLDGLDEVRGEGCVEAINAFRQEHGFVSLAVCSRLDEYHKLKDRLRVQAAVVLQPLTLEQVDAALLAGGEKLLAARTILEDDAKLRELITSPLMLNILILTYGNLSEEKLTGLDSLGDRRTYLFERYVERMLRHRDGEEYDTDQFKRQLAWLARYMSHRAQMIFSIEDLQPDALTRKGTILHALSVSLIMSLSFGLVIGTAVWLISLGWVTMPAAAVDGAIGGLGFAVAIGAGYWTTRGGSFGIAFGVSTGLAVGLPMALSTRDIGIGIVAGLAVASVTSVAGWLAFGPRGTLVVSRNVIQSVEILSWSWTRASVAFGSVLALCTVAGITIYPVVFPVGAAYRWLVTLGLSWGLGVGLLVGIFFALTKGLTPREVPTRVMPNQGIRWTAQNALRVTVGIALVAALITAFVRLPGIMVGGLVSGGLPYGLLFGLLGWMFFGGLTLIQHAALRIMLWRSGNAPLNYARFLDACVARIMLRRVGGGYMFVHRLLLAYFADLEMSKIKE